ncbi:MAG: UDP-N-acetylmuramoyl-L-alanine--D-glutamate ligase [Patescibacteria group bacterium]|nr:UDP-N-acetylmuramoyl-L-alanine--D-glutamate ligase [Patescibacteria group bacterium]
MINFKEKKIAVVNSGGIIESTSSAEFFEKLGAKVTVIDQTRIKDSLAGLDKYDLVVRSPGMKISILEKFVPREKITSQTKLFFNLCPAKIIGVTGTKGKGTTSSLIYEMLKKQGFDAYLGGNIGKPPFEFLDKLNAQSIVVLELSSFQLLDMDKSPHIAVMLMTTSEHLDWHKDLKEYVDAKRNILKFQTEKDFAIINKDYLASRESDIETKGQIYYVTRIDEAQRGCFVKDNAVWIRNGDLEEKIINAHDILIPGEHNYENACSASMAAYLYGVSVQNIAHVLKTFKGLEHRLELVAEVNRVKYYNDSFSTIPETAIAAINAFKNPEILILGGSSKNSNFEELGRVISNAKNIKAIIGIGIEWERIKSKIQNTKYEILFVEGADRMDKIVKAASKLAVSGDVVLLTPACASFDMFKNYKDRGNQFKQQVLLLKQNESN